MEERYNYFDQKRYNRDRCGLDQKAKTNLFGKCLAVSQSVCSSEKLLYAKT